MKFTSEHDALRRTTRQFVENEINPFTAEWEAAGRFPIHEVFKKMGVWLWIILTIWWWPKN